MLRVQTDNGEVRVDFVHVRFHKDEDSESNNHHAITYCLVQNGDGSLRNGIALCSVRDNFDRAIGRKLSLTRALRGLDKPTRTSVWNKYFTVSKRR